MKSPFTHLLGLAVLGFFLINSAPHRLGNVKDHQRLTVPFYTQPIQVTYDPGMRVTSPRAVDNQSISRTYSQVRKRPSRILLNSLLKAKSQYQLNDFLFYKLAKMSVAAIYDDQDLNAQRLSLYGLLIDAGFDARITYRGNRMFVNVYTREDLFEVPIIDVLGRPYANLSCMDGNCDGRARLFIHGQHPNPLGESFSFQLRRWPLLAVQPVQRTMRFKYAGRMQGFDVTFDQTMVQIMEDYPFIHEYCYLETPLSPTLRNSLLPQLAERIEPLNEQQSLEFLASFTRSAFNYKEDNENFGRSKPMVPEELFGYSFSDCEDRSALFFALVRDLMGLPMAVIAYDDHLTIAVGHDDIPGDEFTYENQRYVFVDPTGPKNSSTIGRIPPGYERKRFQIIGTYR